MNNAILCKNFITLLLQKLGQSLPGLAALSFEKLMISDHLSSTFGKYFEAKESTKSMTNSYAETAGMFARSTPVNTELVDPACLQSYLSIQLKIYHLDKAF